MTPSDAVLRDRDGVLRRFDRVYEIAAERDRTAADLAAVLP
ncbi:hypothetical protein [Nonomuraea indica]|nr:hypothetical protein [Nonomuraea indica]